MYFKFPCTGCGKNLKAREEHIGRRVGCPYCKAAVTVPEPPAAEAPAAEEFSFTPAQAGSRPAAATPGRARQRPKGTSGPRRSDGTNVSLLWSGAMGTGLTLLLLAVLYPLREAYVGQLFLNRGWIPYAETFLMCWSLAILFLKYRKLARQRRSMLFDLLPTEYSEEITVGALDRFTRHIRSLPGDTGESFLIVRVLRGLEHFGVRKSAPEAASILQSQSEIDANTVASSYAMLKVFIWAIPILGFIGTVIGISDAVGGFSGAMDKADDISVIKDSLNNVTSGLSTAFDTTLLALLMSMLIKFPTSSLQKAEEDMLSWVDEYCNENLLKRLNDGREGGAERGSGGGRTAIQQAVDAAMREHHVELRSWSQRLEKIGQALSQDVADGWKQVNGQAQETWREAQEALQKQQQEQLQQAQQLAEMSAQVQQSLNQSTAGLERLNEVLLGLGERQIVIQAQPAAAPRRGWFFWPSRRAKAQKGNGTP